MARINANTRRCNQLSKKLLQALKFLVPIYGQNKNVVNFLNSALPVEEQIDEQVFSKLINEIDFNRNTEAKFYKIFAVLDPLLSKEYGRVWDSKSKRYIKLKAGRNVITDPERLHELIGHWKGYS